MKNWGKAAVIAALAAGTAKALPVHGEEAALEQLGIAGNADVTGLGEAVRDFQKRSPGYKLHKLPGRAAPVKVADERAVPVVAAARESDRMAAGRIVEEKGWSSTELSLAMRLKGHDTGLGPRVHGGSAHVTVDPVHPPEDLGGLAELAALSDPKWDGAPLEEVAAALRESIARRRPANPYSVRGPVELALPMPRSYPGQPTPGVKNNCVIEAMRFFGPLDSRTKEILSDLGRATEWFEGFIADIGKSGFSIVEPGLVQSGGERFLPGDLIVLFNRVPGAPGITPPWSPVHAMVYVTNVGNSASIVAERRGENGSLGFSTLSDSTSYYGQEVMLFNAPGKKRLLVLRKLDLPGRRQGTGCAAGGTHEDRQTRCQRHGSLSPLPAARSARPRGSRWPGRG